MMYAFHNNQLYKQDRYIEPRDVPPHTYVLCKGYEAEWYVRYDRSYFRRVPPKHVPKELKVLCLLLGIPL